MTFEDGTAVRLRPTAPRRFAATVGGVTAGLHHVALQVGRLRRDVDLMVPSQGASPREHRPGPPNVDLLRTLADATGGAMDASPERLLAARPGSERERQPLVGWLVLVAIAAVLGDVAVRRRAE